jgi:regulator of protease activity HflC (stomatin/prohibitin superfamily)
MKTKTNRGDAAVILLVVVCVFVAVGGIGGCMWGYPTYNVYSQRKAGEAMLAHAQASKEVAVAEARAKMESASLLADAEIARARGVAQANQIIGASLKENEAYLRYLWINGLESNNPTVIYVPTEGGLPILEAGRRPTTAR